MIFLDPPLPDIVQSGFRIGVEYRGKSVEFNFCHVHIGN